MYFFSFFIVSNFEFYLVNAPVYADIDQALIRETQSCSKWKMKKTKWVFFFYKYSKFWSVLPDKKVDLKPLFSEECDDSRKFGMPILKSHL